MKFYILVEDHAKPESGFKSEHGLSIFFECDEKRFLFDCGTSGLLLVNAEKLGVDLSDLDFVIFSHGHFDHTGGFAHLMLNDKTRIVAHPGFLETRDLDRDSLIDFNKKECKKRLELSKKPLQLSEHVVFLGEIPRGMKRVGFMLDDSALAVNIDEYKTVILSGCAHSGIENIVKYVNQLFSPPRIIVIGGFHMWDYKEKEINELIKELAGNKVKEIYPGHCTGELAEKLLTQSFSGEILHAGKIIEV